MQLWSDRERGPRSCFRSQEVSFVLFWLQVAGRLQWWTILLSAYTYDIEFKPTLSHGNADALSQLPLQQDPNWTFSTDASVFNI